MFASWATDDKALARSLALCTTIGVAVTLYGYVLLACCSGRRTRCKPWRRCIIRTAALRLQPGSSQPAVITAAAPPACGNSSSNSSTSVWRRCASRRAFVCAVLLSWTAVFVGGVAAVGAWRVVWYAIDAAVRPVTSSSNGALLAPILDVTMAMVGTLLLSLMGAVASTMGAPLLVVHDTALPQPWPLPQRHHTRARVGPAPAQLQANAVAVLPAHTEPQQAARETPKRLQSDTSVPFLPFRLLPHAMFMPAQHQHLASQTGAAAAGGATTMDGLPCATRCCLRCVSVVA